MLVGFRRLTVSLITVTGFMLVILIIWPVPGSGIIG
jgi:hypothetical protein